MNHVIATPLSPFELSAVVISYTAVWLKKRAYSHHYNNVIFRIQKNLKTALSYFSMKEALFSSLKYSGSQTRPACIRRDNSQNRLCILHSPKANDYAAAGGGGAAAAATIRTRTTTLTTTATTTTSSVYLTGSWLRH